MTEYTLLKLLHLGALIFWLGPALGAWLVLKAIGDRHQHRDPIAHKVTKAFYWMIVMEHIAFAVLLVSGFTLAVKFGFLSSPWLTQKLWIIGLVIIPLEMLDILLGNWLAARAELALFNGKSLAPIQQKAIGFYHGTFTKLAIILIPISVTLVMFLAISKSPIITIQAQEINVPLGSSDYAVIIPAHKR